MKTINTYEKEKVITLIELLVVIAIISILMTILLPALKNAKDYSKRALCLANQKQIGVALSAYAGDFNSFLPTLNDYHSYFLSYGGNKTNMGQLIPDYLNKGAAKVFFCPHANKYVIEDCGYNYDRLAKYFLSGTNIICSYHYRSVFPVNISDLPKPGIRLGNASGNTAIVAEYFHHDGTGSAGSRVFYLSHCSSSAAFQGQNVVSLDGGAKWYKMSSSQLSVIDPHSNSYKSTHKNMWYALDER